MTPPGAERPSTAPLLTTVAWGVFCACSWTWCIGMYLPKILIERSGLAGFTVFAVANVVGCAGFGYVVRRADIRSRIARHRPAMVVFSVVAVAFHMLFAGIVVGHVLGPEGSPWWGTLAALGVLLAGAALVPLGDRAWLGLAVLLYALSIGVLVRIGFGAMDALPTAATHPPTELAWLAPIIVIGFLLCPYLDLTFHRALERAPSRHAFAVFGATFSVMLLLTVLVWFAPSPVLLYAGLLHLTAQAIFTVGAHLREVRLHARGTARWWALAAPVAAAGLLPVVREITDAAGLADDLYVRALVFYALAFPAYVLVFMAPGRAVLRRPALLALGAAVVALAPACEFGFLHDRAWLLVIPVGAGATWLAARWGSRTIGHGPSARVAGMTPADR